MCSTFLLKHPEIELTLWGTPRCLLVELFRGRPAPVGTREVVPQPGWHPAVLGVPPVRALAPGQRHFEGREEVVYAVRYDHAVVGGHEEGYGDAAHACALEVEQICRG